MPWSVVPLIWGRLILTLSYRSLSIPAAPKSTYLLDTPDFKFTHNEGQCFLLVLYPEGVLWDS